MVGLNVISSADIEGLEHKISRVIDGMIHYPSYHSKEFYRGEGLIIGSTAYKEYPIEIMEDDEVLFVIEGHIYNADSQAIHLKLHDIINSYRKKNELKENVREAMQLWDGEYIILVYRKKENCILMFNDKLGRLPFFYMVDAGSFAASREMKFVYPFMAKLTYDRVAMAEYLLYGFPLGQRTIIDGVYRLPPATLIKHDGDDHSLAVEQIIPINFKRMLRPKADQKEALMGLKSAFMEGMKSRVNTLDAKNIVIALSGGLDSRATLAGLIQLGVIPKAKTYDTDPDNVSEIEVTQNLADIFGVPLDYVSLPHDMGWNIPMGYHNRFVHLFDGAPPTRFSNLMMIQEQIVKEEGHGITYFTGLYGGEMLRYLGITSGLRSEKDLTKYLMTTPDKFRYSGNKVCRILDMQMDELEDHLSRHISEYPEDNPKLKYLHFQFEKNYRWAGIGEDRNRYFFWTTTPFFSMPFFDYAYSVDEKLKTTLFFRNFLYELNSKTCDVKYYNNDIPLNDTGKLWRLSILENAARKPYIRKMYWKIIDVKNDISNPMKNDEEIATIKNEIFRLMGTSRVISNILNLDECEDIVRSETDLSMLHRILTLFIFVNEVDICHASTGNRAITFRLKSQSLVLNGEIG